MEVEQLYTAETHSEGAEMQVMDEKFKPTDIYITLVGQDSEIWQKATRERQKRAFGRLVKPEDDDIDHELEEMVSASIAWRGIERAGAPLEFSAENVRQLYINAPYIKDQAILFVANRVNFMKGKDKK